MPTMSRRAWNPTHKQEDPCSGCCCFIIEGLRCWAQMEVGSQSWDYVCVDGDYSVKNQKSSPAKSGNNSRLLQWSSQAEEKSSLSLMYVLLDLITLSGFMWKRVEMVWKWLWGTTEPPLGWCCVWLEHQPLSRAAGISRTTGQWQKSPGCVTRTVDSQEGMGDEGQAAAVGGGLPLLRWRWERLSWAWLTGS